MPRDELVQNPCLVPFARPDLSETEVAAAVGVLRSGWLIEGAVTEALERSVGEAVGNSRIVASNSATSAFLTVLMALGIGRGDEVIFPVWTFTSPPLVARLLGATPIFVDIREADYNIDPAAVAAAITRRTKAIVPTHFGGNPADMKTLHDIASASNIPIIEDAAHALGAVQDGRTIGICDRSVATVFSTYATKCITTAEGGLTAVVSDRLRDSVRRAGRCGIDKGTFARDGSPDPFPDYDVVALGIKASLPDLLAAIGLAQIERVGKMQERRTEIAARYADGLADLAHGGALRLPSPPTEPGTVPTWHLYVIRLESDRPDAAAKFVRRMRRSGVQCSVHFKPLHRHSFWRQGHADIHPVPCAERLNGRTVSLPIWSAMSDDQVDTVIDAVTASIVD